MRKFTLRRSRSSTVGGLLLAALVVLAIVFVSPAAAGSRPTAATPPPADDTLLRELAERLLTPPGGPPGQPIPTPQLLPGASPADLPLALPVPPDGRLVGSVARRAGDALVGAEVVFDAPGAPADTAAFYERVLGPQGWTPTALGGPGPPFGFQPSGAATFRVFCAPPGGTGSLTLQVLATTTGPGDLRLRLDLTNPGPCGAGGGAPRPNLPPGAERLPLLVAPDGSQVSPGGGGGGGNRFASDAFAATDLTVAALHDAYAAQLAAADWARVAGGADGPLAWSTWRLPGAGDFVGFLYVLQGTGARQRELHVQAAAPYPGGPGGGPPPVAPPAPPVTAPTAPALPPATPTPTDRLVQPTRTTLVPAAP